VIPLKLDNTGCPQETRVIGLVLPGQEKKFDDIFSHVNKMEYDGQTDGHDSKYRAYTQGRAVTKLTKKKTKQKVVLVSGRDTRVRVASTSSASRECETVKPWLQLK